MKRRKMTAAACCLMITAVLSLSACGGRQAASVVIAGSTSVQPYVEVLAEEYARLRPDSVIDIQGGGSSAGITAVESDTAHIGMSSRNLKESERHLWKAEIAKDGLAIIVHPSNPVENLTRGQLRDVYTADVTNWSQLGGPDARIHIIAREEGSGTRSAFDDLVMAERRIAHGAIVQDSNGAVRQLVADDPYSIGFISLGLVDLGERPVKVVRIDGVAPTRESVLDAEYPLYRSFLFVAKEEPVGPARQFLDFIFSEAGRRLLTDEGLVAEDWIE
ncbi:MAG: phosphate ABC transporter substrate-binding protein [Oscillospiraceae bacterium]|nr:phosphate ABC transporter substrate-binding protein [Oscillospiraceae bacterium]